MQVLVFNNNNKKQLLERSNEFVGIDHTELRKMEIVNAKVS